MSEPGIQTNHARLVTCCLLIFDIM
jgi:hypothetical protein